MDANRPHRTGCWDNSGLGKAKASPTDDLDAAFAEAVELGYEIVYPITTEPWGVRRFFARAPEGNVFNIVAHWD